MKMTYSEQLKHPKWQKIRLEVLSRANFRCQICGDDETTLNVHHKRYIKGRMAWEYDMSNFEALCENCHECTHEAKDRIMSILTIIPSVRWSEVADTLLGWAAGYPGANDIDQQSPYSFSIGMLANELEVALNMSCADAIIGQLRNWDRSSRLIIEIPVPTNAFASLDDIQTPKKSGE